MNLLLNRSQGYGSFSLIPLRIGAGTVFKLNATLEIDDEEDALFRKYRLMDTMIDEGDSRDTFARAMRSGMFLGLLTFVALVVASTLVDFRHPLARLSYFNMLAWSLVVFVLMTGIYYRSLRETLSVRDLFHGGRTFRCDSVVDLIQKEAYLEGRCAYLRQLLESAKHWGEREVIPIKPLEKEEAKRAVLRAS